ncbi:MAG: DUF4351 domain-containing protein, partial [Cyanobacteria bacterium J06592_8]
TILHLEFQTRPDPEIPFRMADYRIRIYRRYRDKSVRQVVIYLKPTSSPLVQENVFEIPGTRHQFQVIRLWETPKEELLQFPGLLPLAVLGQSENPTQTLYQVQQRIETLSDPNERKNVTAATAILAGLSLNKAMIQQILREEIMEDSVIYQDIVARATAKGLQQGLQQGVQQGLQQGLQQGVQQGLQQGFQQGLQQEATLVLRLLRRRIGEIDANLESRIRSLPVVQLENLGEALLDFTSVSDLRAWLE